MREGIDNTISREEAQTILSIVERADFKGPEVMTVAVLIQKLGKVAMDEAETPKESQVQKMANKKRAKG